MATQALVAWKRPNDNSNGHLSVNTHPVLDTLTGASGQR